MEGSRVKIIDFGLGNWWNRGPLKTSCGSPNYAAPELFTSRCYHGPPVDVWAMGVMLFGMLTGEFPFDEIQSTLDAEYDWPSQPSSAIADIINGIFQTNPDSRLSTANVRACPILQKNGVQQQISTDIRPDLIAKMDQELGMPLELVVKGLRDEEVNQMTATYWILAKQTSPPPPSDALAQVDDAIKKALANAELSLSDMMKQRRESNDDQQRKSSESKVTGAQEPQRAVTPVSKRQHETVDGQRTSPPWQEPRRPVSPRPTESVVLNRSSGYSQGWVVATPTGKKSPTESQKK
jgi:serine/threonine protein kinase